ncbi:hypothetical protein HMI51_38845, partial [Corallococcus coralloides]|nr:hypothetical protein [Corallococcus coralloides]
GGLGWLGGRGHAEWAQFLLVPTFFAGAAYFIAGLLGLLTGRPWDRTPFWMKLPMMIVGAALALTAFILVAVMGEQTLRSATDSTPDVGVEPGE